MLVNCPRCGFTQPQDKYCAQCGVDMETYRPPQPSFAKRILTNPALQISFVLLIAGLVGLNLYQKRQSDLEERVSYLKGGTQVVRNLSSPNELNENESLEETLPSELLSEPASADAALAPSSETPAGETPTLPVAAADASKKAADAPVPGTTAVRLVYAELSLRGRDLIYEESSATGQFNPLGDYIAGILPDVARKLSLSNREIKILHREQRNIEAQKPLQFFQGLNGGNPETEIGFSYYLELTEVDANTFRGNIEVGRSWRVATPAGAPMLEKRQFPAVFELGRGTGFFISGVMPRASLMENDNDLVAQKPFEILRSNDFRSGNSEYFLFLEFVRN
jgi:hypothetical protein